MILRPVLVFVWICTKCICFVFFLNKTDYYNENHSCETASKFELHMIGHSFKSIKLTWSQYIKFQNFPKITLIYAIIFQELCRIVVSLNVNYCMVKSVFLVIKTYIYNLVHTMRFWNNLHQVRSLSKDMKAK